MVKFQKPPNDKEIFFTIASKDGNIIYSHPFFPNRLGEQKWLVHIFSCRKTLDRLIEEKALKDIEVRQMRWGYIRTNFLDKTIVGAILDYSIDSPHVEFYSFSEDN